MLTDHEKYVAEHTEERDGIIMPPQLLCIPRKASVGGDEERDNEQADSKV